MKRRNFLAGAAAAAAGLVLPYEPRRVYSFPTPRLVTPPMFIIEIGGIQALIAKANSITLTQLGGSSSSTCVQWLTRSPRTWRS